MASLWDRLRGGTRDISTIDDYIAALGQYGLMTQPIEQTGKLTTESVAHTFSGYAAGAHAGNAVVFSVLDVRAKVFSAVRFQFQNVRNGKPSDLFGTTELEILERPWEGGTTQDLLARMISDADLAGNSYWTRDGRDLVRLRPDWVSVVVEPRTINGGQVGWRKLGFIYYEGGKHSGNDGVGLLTNEVAHFMPIPDPLASFRGMSWLTPVVREIEADTTMTRHKRKFFENGATPNLIVKHPVGANADKVLAFKKRLEAESAGTDNAYRSLHLYPGADATVVGSNLEQVDFRQVQGAGETRIAAAGGTPPIIVGLSEGLASATYSNYGQARRRFADGTMHPLWQNGAGSLAVLLKTPPSSRLWYDATDVPFLREDEGDAANIARTQASTISSLIQAGYTPDSAVAAIESGDFGLLKHTGLFSVQLQKPGNEQTPAMEGSQA